DETTGIPPLMNPPILEATDDLTMLSHLNEPAGIGIPDTGTYTGTDESYSASSHQVTICQTGNLHIFGNRPYCHKPFRPRGLPLRPWPSPSILWKAKRRSRPAFVCDRRPCLPVGVACCITYFASV